MTRIYKALMDHHDLWQSPSFSAAPKRAALERAALECRAPLPALEPSKHAQNVIDNVKVLWSGAVTPTLASGYGAVNALSGGQLEKHVQRTAPQGSMLQALAQRSAEQEQNLRESAQALREKIIDDPRQVAVDALTYVPRQLKDLGYQMAHAWDTVPETFVATAALGTLELIRGKPRGKAVAPTAQDFPFPLEYRSAQGGRAGSATLLTAQKKEVRVHAYPDSKVFTFEPHVSRHAMAGKEIAAGSIAGRNLDAERVLITQMDLHKDLASQHVSMLEQALRWTAWGQHGWDKNKNAPTGELWLQKLGVDPDLLKRGVVDQALARMDIRVKGRSTRRDASGEYVVLKTEPTTAFSPEAARLALEPLPQGVGRLPLAHFLPQGAGTPGDGVPRGFFSNTVFPTRAVDPKSAEALLQSIVRNGFDPLHPIMTIRLIDTRHDVLFDGHRRLEGLHQLVQNGSMSPTLAAMPRRHLNFHDISFEKHMALANDAQNSVLGPSPQSGGHRKYLKAR